MTHDVPTLYRHLYPVIRENCRRLVGDAAAHDVAQETFLRVLKTDIPRDDVDGLTAWIDSCRGGTWTQAKGLVPSEPFEPPPTLLTEGTALVASSSGVEDAHEADSLQGSFFTHHLVAGLRGAADVSGDGQVSLQEAFGYANRLTIRDTAAHARLAQHPSFELRLHGRNDLMLTSVGGPATVLALAQKKGPLEIVQLSTGVTLVEAPAGEQLIRVVLPPGPYLVRQLAAEGVWSREVQVVAGQTTTVAETSLTLEGHPFWSSKGVGLGDAVNHSASVLLGVSWGGAGEWSREVNRSFTDWSLSARAGYSFTVSDRVTLNLGATVKQTLLRDGRPADLTRGEGQTTLDLGGIGLGLQSLPLLQAHLTPTFSLNMNVGLQVNLSKPETTFTYSLGFTQRLPTGP